MGRRSLAWFRTLEMSAACLVFALLVLCIAAGSAGRYLGVPLIASLELAQALFVWLCVLAADLTLQRDGHFSVDVLTRLLPVPLQKLLAIVNLLVIAALLLFLLWHGIRFAAVTSDRPLPITGIPSAYVTGALPFGFALMLLTLCERIHAILTRPAPADMPAARHEGL